MLNSFAIPTAIVIVYFALIPAVAEPTIGGYKKLRQRARDRRARRAIAKDEANVLKVAPHKTPAESV